MPHGYYKRPGLTSNYPRPHKCHWVAPQDPRASMWQITHGSGYPDPDRAGLPPFSSPQNQGILGSGYTTRHALLQNGRGRTRCATAPGITRASSPLRTRSRRGRLCDEVGVSRTGDRVGAGDNDGHVCLPSATTSVRKRRSAIQNRAEYPETRSQDGYSYAQRLQVEAED